jgi:hypothetical protein
MTDWRSILLQANTLLAVRWHRPNVSLEQLLTVVCSPQHEQQPETPRPGEEEDGPPA